MVAPGVEVAPAGPRMRARSHLHRGALAAVLLPLLPAVSVAAVQETTALARVAPALWALVALTALANGRGRQDVGDAVRADARDGLALCALTAVAAVFLVVPLDAARSATVVVLVATASSCLLRLVVGGPRTSRRMVVIGRRSDVDLHLSLCRHRARVVGCFVTDTGPALASSSAVPTATSLESLSTLLTSVRPDAVLVLPGSAEPALVGSLASVLESRPTTRLWVAPPLPSVAPGRLRVRSVDLSPVLEVHLGGGGPLPQLVKGGADRVGAALLLLACLPVLALLWLAVRLDSPGPGFYVSTRIGQGGTPFRMLKLRSMRDRAEEGLEDLLGDNQADSTLFKIRRDPRVTGLGYWLRRLSLDELPQLVNVLRGDMSLVGPRPALPAEVATYDARAWGRLLVKPGMTGLWQVSGRSDLLWEDALRLDLFYADNWSLRGDLAIAARTLRAVALGRGAY